MNNKATLERKSGMNRQELTTRFDKNLAHNTYDFNKYKEDATLIRNLVVYLAFSYQEDLWGYGTLDPVKFAKHMGYKDHRSLYKKVSEPAQFENLSDEEIKQIKDDPNEYVWDDLLDNALYKMAHQPLSLSFGGRAASGENFYGIKTMLILTSVNVYFDEKNPQKRYYKFKASGEFLSNLSRYFLTLNLKSFTALRENRLQPLYLYLCNLRETLKLKKELGTPGFDLICKQAGIGDKEPKQRKKKVNQKLGVIQKKAPELGLQWDWEKNGRFLYKLVIWFEYPDSDKLLGRQQHNLFFMRILVRLLYQEFCKFHNQEAQEAENKVVFYQWLDKPDQDPDVKRSAICNAFLQHYGKTIDAFDNQVWSVFRSLDQLEMLA
jgi:hypothetical protein